MRNQVKIGTSDGETHFADGWASEIHKRVNSPEVGRFIALESTETPSRTFYLDPNEIISIKDD